MEKVLRSGVIVCLGRKFNDNDRFRTVARFVCDQFFPEESSQDSDLVGTFYRYEKGKIEGPLNWKERLWGEWSVPPLEFDPLVRYYRNGELGLVSFRELTNAQFDFLIKVLKQMKLYVEVYNHEKENQKTDHPR